MEHPSITKLRETAATPHNPRNTSEWPMPVLPSDLLVLFKHYDELLKAQCKCIPPVDAKVDVPSAFYSHYR